MFSQTHTYDELSKWTLSQLRTLKVNEDDIYRDRFNNFMISEFEALNLISSYYTTEDGNIDLDIQNATVDETTKSTSFYRHLNKAYAEEDDVAQTFVKTYVNSGYNLTRLGNWINYNDFVLTYSNLKEVIAPQHTVLSKVLKMSGKGSTQGYYYVDSVKSSYQLEDDEGAFTNTYYLNEDNLDMVNGFFNNVDNQKTYYNNGFSDDPQLRYVGLIGEMLSGMGSKFALSQTMNGKNFADPLVTDNDSMLRSFFKKTFHTVQRVFTLEEYAPYSTNLTSFLVAKENVFTGKSTAAINRICFINTTRENLTVEDREYGSAIGFGFRNKIREIKMDPPTVAEKLTAIGTGILAGLATVAAIAGVVVWILSHATPAGPIIDAIIFTVKVVGTALLIAGVTAPMIGKSVHDLTLKNINFGAPDTQKELIRAGTPGTWENDQNNKTNFQKRLDDYNKSQNG